MSKITVDFSKVTGKIKPMHAVGQPPMRPTTNNIHFTALKWLQDANIPYSRLHDVGGPFGGNRFVDIPNIFRDFDADVYDPEAYDFVFTDLLLKGMAEYNVKPIFRLGVTIENQCNFKAYRIHPPKDYKKWAKICEHIIRHYNEGWANGFEYGIEYWEIWNEPENRKHPRLNQMWTGTAEEYYELYDVAAKHLKKCFGDKIKVGGYAATGFYKIFSEPEMYGMNIEKKEGPRYSGENEDYRMDFLYGFFDYIKEHNSPIDFFSWHSYVGNEDTVVMAEFLHKFLSEKGYGELETMLNEWNSSARTPGTLGTDFASAEAASMLLAMQNTHTYMLCYYDTRFVVGMYCGMFDAVKAEPHTLYYSFKAFGQLYALRNQVSCESDTDKLFAVAATDGEKKGVMISNTTGGDALIETNLEGDFEVYFVGDGYKLEKAEVDAGKFMLKENQVAYIGG